jgi:FkbM family methyltransferase
MLKNIKNFGKKVKLQLGLSYKAKPKFDKPCKSSESLLSCIIAYNELGGYCIPQSSIYFAAAQRTMEGVIHEAETVKFIVDNYANGDIIHAGTYYGDFLPVLSASCSSDAKIWAFDPNVENYRCASITIMINSLTNINLFNKGLGKSENEARLITKNSQGESVGGTGKILLGNENIDETLTQTVSIIALDDLIPEDRVVSLIHLDIEGYEQQALSGALKTIKRCLPLLILETVPEKGWLSENIISLGYTLTGLVLDGRNQVLKPPISSVS